MSDPLKAVLAPADLKATAFPPGSRYHGVEVKAELIDGEQRVYVARRFVPPQDQFSVVQEYRVVDGDRLDNLAARFIGDPEQYWQLCDANAVLSPEALERPGEIIMVTLPAGVPGAADG
jgi:hypothetical protein